MNARTRLLSMTLIGLLLSACGGGGSGEDVISNTQNSASTSTQMTALHADRDARDNGPKHEPDRCMRYEFTALDTLGGTGSASHAINEAGHVVGESQLQGDQITHAVLWAERRAVDLGTLGGTRSVAYDINDHGKIVGSSNIAGDAVGHATLWHSGKVVDLGAGGGISSVAQGINNHGQIVGYTSLGTATHLIGVRWEDRTSTQLPLPQGPNGVSSLAYGINDAGLIVGTSTGPFLDDPLATLWSPAQDPVLFGAMDARAYRLNKTGTIVGSTGFHPGFGGSAFVRVNATTIVLTGLFSDTLGRFAGVATGINDRGQVVGATTVDANSTTHAALWNDYGAKPTDLNDLLSMDDIGAGWSLRSAVGINNKGWITGTAYNTLTGRTQAYLMALVTDKNGRGKRDRGLVCDSNL